jgi:hypothetical protein
MYNINRAIVIIKMKQPYIDWIKNLPDSDFGTGKFSDLHLDVKT